MLLTFFELKSEGSMDMFGILYMMLAYAVILFLTLPVHELAHGLAAYWCGDKTAKAFGRLSLNPLRHLDVFGTIMILTVGMGYAKPVPINPRNFRHPRLDTVLVSLAGPFSNFLMAWLGMIGIYVSALLNSRMLMPNSVYVVVTMILEIIFSVNISLMVFNLLPIPPLDGSRLWSVLLPGRWAEVLERYSQYITMALFLLLATGALRVPLSFLQNVATFVLALATEVMFIPVELILSMIP